MTEGGYYELQVYGVGDQLISTIIFFPESGASMRYPTPMPPQVGEVRVEYHPPKTEREPMAPGFLRFEENTLRDNHPPT